MQLFTIIVEDLERHILESPLVFHVKAKSSTIAKEYIENELCSEWDIEAETFEQDFDILVIPVIENEIYIAK
jgi:hypothetical protein